VYYCLHFQELPWSSAQASDKIYAEYAAQCASPQLTVAGVPFLKTITSASSIAAPVMSDLGTPHHEDSSSTTPTVGNLPPIVPSVPGTSGGISSQSRSERDKELERESATPYPKLIQHLSPRACRPVLRRMLEPRPELRVTIEDVLRYPWVAQIEVCTEPGVTPNHIHPAAIAAAAAAGIVQGK
jgi:serine/threonine protein kinase